MSTEPVIQQEDASHSGSADPILDVSKLHALPTEQQDLYLLSFVSDLRHHVTSLSPESLPQRQPTIKKEILKIIGLGSPTSSRVIRHSLGRILADIFTRGSRQLLHETINDLLGVINAGKGEKDIWNKHAATTCIGQLFEAAGDSAVSLHGLVVSSLLKSMKASQAYTGFRGSIFRALDQVVRGLSSSIDEQVARDIWKSARNVAPTDKSGFIQKCACLCIRTLWKLTPYFSNSTDFEQLKNVAWKVMDSPVVGARNAAARMLAVVLIRLFNDTATSESFPAMKKPKKSTKKQDKGSDDDGEIERPGSPNQVRNSSRLALGLTDLLRVISSQYCRASVSNKSRTALAMCYKMIFEDLPERTVQDRYGTIVQHLLDEIINHPTIHMNRYRLLLSRKLVHILLSDVITSEILTESGQISASRWLINDLLKNYPAVIQGRKEPSKRSLTAALSTLTHLLKWLGPASSSFQDSCREALFQVAQHPSYTVQVHVAECFRTFIAVCPNQLTRTVEQALSQAKKELEQGEARSYRRSVGHAMITAAALRSARNIPLYGSLELFSGAFSFATELLKASASSELRLCAVQVQVAWTIISGLMALGPSFVKVHLNQLLLLWRNALPPPLTQDNSARRSQLELSFLAHVRETALAALLTFLNFNSNLVTSDGSKRISSMLNNSISFVNSLPGSRQTEDLSNRLVAALQLHDYAVMLKRRILQCMTKLLSLKHLDRNDIVSQSDIVGMAIRTFSSPERPLLKNLEATLASSATNFEGLWELGDNWAYGLNSLVDVYEVLLPNVGPQIRIGPGDKTVDPLEGAISRLAGAPILPALEHDSVVTWGSDVEQDTDRLFAPETACLTAAIQLFAVALPLQPARIQESCFEQIATVMSQPLQREPGRKSALHLNAFTAILCALGIANGETSFHAGKLAASSISKITAEILRRGVIDPEPITRAVATQALGRLCYLSGHQFTNDEVKHLIDTIVANRDSHVRAGCALALGMIHSQVGAMAASYHLKNIIGVLLSLCNDSHPVVHFWALKGLAEVAESAGLSFSAYASSALGVLAQLYSSDSHNEESPSLASSNVEMEQSTPLVIGQCIDSIINVLGPDLQDIAKTRSLVLTLVQYLRIEASIPLQVQSYICLGHISLYAPAHVQLTSYVQSLQQALSSSEPLLEEVAISGLETLTKRSATEVLRVSKAGFGDEIWSKLDKHPSSPLLRTILRSWMQQTCLEDTLSWVQQCQTILSKTRVKQESKSEPTPAAKTAVPDLADEEVAGFAAAAAVAEGDKPEASIEGQEFLRWQTRNFAMELLSEMLDLVKDALSPDQIIPAESALQSKVADIVKIAFSASTATVVDLRIRGLHILDQILKLFGRTPDPDFLEASLLEQYQAQISSALTPAFASDSNPELAAEAISVCATFVATGIVTNADRMGRIFKVLATGLDNFSLPKPEAAIGDLIGLSSNAQSMLKMSLLSGWAQLQLASVEQVFLEEIVHPVVPKLAPLWLASLQEFAGLRFEPEISDSLGDYVSSNLHERYATFDREVRLRFYQRSWLSIVDAIALLVEKDSNAVFNALDNKQGTIPDSQINGTSPSGKDMSFREEPVAFFFILYGLAYEALVTQARDDPAHALAILQALKRILTPAVSGSAIYQDSVFGETTDTLDRLALTSPSETQAVLVQIARNLSLDHVVAKSEGRDDKLSDDIDQLFELTRIIILVLTGLVPTLEDPPGKVTRVLTEETMALVQLSFQALVDVAEVFPSIIRADLHACIVHCYCAILATGICQDEAVPRIMPIFRQFLASFTKIKDDSTTRLVRGCLHRMLEILSIAQRRENEYAIVCARNTLLSITVLVTTTSSTLPAEDRLVAKAITEILECLQDVGLAKIATGCVRSFLVTSPKTFCDESIARIIFPEVLQYVMDQSAEDPESVKSALMQALTSSLASLRGQGKAAGMSILVPCLLARARYPVPNGSKEDLAKESAARLLELASIDGQAFRVTIPELGELQREQLQQLLRSTGAGNRRRTDTETSEESKPAIALRMDFD